MVRDLIDKDPIEVDPFELLIFQLVSSENCPYTCSELWNMLVSDLFNVRKLVFVRDAISYAKQKDKENKSSTKTRTTGGH